MGNLYLKILVWVLLAGCAVLAVDRARLSLRLSGISARIVEKTKIIEENETRYREHQKLLESALAEMGNRFQLVLPDTPAPLPFRTKDVPDSLRKTAEKLKTDADRSPGRVKLAFLEWMSSHNPRGTLFFDADTGSLGDSNAAALEYLSRSAGLILAGRHIWDSKLGVRRTDLRISGTERGSAGALVTLGVGSGTGDIVIQDSVRTTVFPFENLMLTNYKVHEVLPPGNEIPLGGLYIHSFRAFSTGPWYLEYEFPEGTDPDAARLRALPLGPGVTVTSAVTGRVQTFRIVPKGNDSAFLVTGDRAFVPVRATLGLFRQAKKRVRKAEKAP